jgi:hypothetical protein
MMVIPHSGLKLQPAEMDLLVVKVYLEYQVDTLVAEVQPALAVLAIAVALVADLLVVPGHLPLLDILGQMVLQEI